MTQAESSSNSYFTLDNPSLNNKPQPTTNNATTKSGLLNRRQQHASYLPQLELPSLPPLSQLLTTDKVKKENTNPQLQQTNTTASDAAVAVAVAAGMMPPNMNYPPPQQQQQQQQLYYNNNTTANNNMTQLMDPTTMDTMYNLQPGHPTNNTTDPATTAAMVAAAAAAVGYGMPMPPTTQALMEGPPQLQHPQHSLQNQHHHHQQHQQRQRQLSSSSTSSAEKIYSFVAIPGTNQKKRPRRRYDEIERLYHCNWSGCTKAYGTLNHLNAHVSMQKHVSNFLLNHVLKQVGNLTLSL
ncbi:unnamed protein product [Mucor hiemalis]